ncbi:MAG: beta strand repeat-containing protein, partial [Candidatus Methylumidiphilus sp.]
LTVSNGAKIIGNATESMTITASSDSGSVTVQGGNSQILGNNTKDLTVSAGGNVKVNAGGLINKINKGNLTVTAPVVRVADADSKIMSSSSDGAMLVKATGEDIKDKDGKTTQAALSVLSGGQMTGNNGSTMSMLADIGSISVDGTGSKITGANTGFLQVGDDRDAVGSNPAVHTKLVSVTSGGVIEKTAGTDLTLKGQRILVDAATVQTDSSPTGTFKLEATGPDISTDSPALAIRNSAKIIGGKATGDMSVLADRGSISVAGGSINGANTGFLQVGDVVGANINTRLVSVTSAGSINKTTGGNLNIRAGSVVVDGAGSSIHLLKPATGGLLVEATAGDESAKLLTPTLPAALTVSNGGKITLNKSDGMNNSGDMKLMASNANGTIKLLSSGSNLGTVERLSAGSLQLSARNVVVNGLLESADNLDITGNPTFTADWTTTEKAIGTTQTTNLLTVSGGLKTGSATGQDIVVSGNMTTAIQTNAGRDVSVTGLLDSGTTTATRNISLTGGTLRVGANATATTGDIKIVKGGKIVSSSGNEMTVRADQGIIQVGDSQSNPTDNSNFGQIIKSTDGNLIVTGKNVLVEGKDASAGSVAVSGIVFRADVNNLINPPTASVTGDLTVLATGSDATLSVIDSGQIFGNNKGNISVLASLGTVNVARGSINGANTGFLQVGDVDGASINTRLVSVTSGGIIDKTAGTDLTLKGQRILVDAATVQTGSSPSGTFKLEATGLDATLNDPALFIRNGAKINGNNTGNMQIYADNGSVRISNFGTITGANKGELNVGTDVSDLTKSQVTSKQVSVLSGGKIEKTAGTSAMTVRA